MSTRVTVVAMFVLVAGGSGTAATPSPLDGVMRAPPSVVLDDFSVGTLVRATACPSEASAVPKDCVTADQQKSRKTAVGAGMVFPRRTLWATTETNVGKLFQRATVFHTRKGGRDRLEFTADDPRQGENHLGYHFEHWLMYGDWEGVNPLNLALLDLVDGNMKSKFHITLGRATNFAGELELQVWTRTDTSGATLPMSVTRSFKANKRQKLKFPLKAFVAPNGDLNDVDYIHLRVEGYTDDNSRGASAGDGIYQRDGVTHARLEVRQLAIFQPKKTSR